MGERCEIHGVAGLAVPSGGAKRGDPPRSNWKMALLPEAVLAELAVAKGGERNCELPREI